MAIDRQDSSATLDVCTLVMVALEGAYRLFDDLGKHGTVAVLERYNRLVRELGADCRGREIELAHRFLFRFDRPLDGVHFCLALHDRLPELGDELGVALVARCGIHLDEIVQWENSSEDVARGARPRELDGPARQRVTHLTSIAHPRQTLITRFAHDLAQRAGKDELGDDVAWADHGSHLFPEGREPFEVFEVGRRDLAPFLRPGVREDVSMEMDALPWQPAEGLPLPGRQHWVLKRRLDVDTAGDAWVGSQQRVRDQHTFLLALDIPGQLALRHELSLLRALREALRDPPFLARPLEARLREQPYYLELDDRRGRPLAEWLASDGDASGRLAVLTAVADMLATCHAAGVVLGTLTPRRLLIVENATDVVLAGVTGCLITNRALAAELDLEDAPARLPPEPYRAPELSDGAAVTPASDLYAAGVLFYQLIVGNLEARPGPYWQRGVEDVLLRQDIGSLLDPDPVARPSAADLLSRLRTLDERRLERSVEEPPVPRSESAGVQRWVAALVAAGGFVAGLALGAVFF